MASVSSCWLRPFSARCRRHTASARMWEAAVPSPATPFASISSIIAMAPSISLASNMASSARLNACLKASSSRVRIAWEMASLAFRRAEALMPAPLASSSWDGCNPAAKPIAIARSTSSASGISLSTASASAASAALCFAVGAAVLPDDLGVMGASGGSLPGRATGLPASFFATSSRLSPQPQLAVSPMSPSARGARPRASHGSRAAKW
mmetsp:Transcript_111446/g.311524  ORF Transcript_111446/g.311524 Transcript_111446/m.311524 type:complete len:209 (-) Transcript_111446:8-634(-)